MPETLKKQVLELSRQLDELKLLLGCGNFTFDNSNKSFYFDEACCRLLGIEAGNPLEQDILLRMVHADDRNTLKDFLLPEFNSGNKGIELRLIQEGARPIKDLMFHRLPAREETALISGTIQDIGTWKRRETELLHELEKSVESDRMKTVFLTNLSHELRTPMNTIIGFSELINIVNTPAEKRKEYSRIIRNKGQELLTLIDDIIEVSRFEADQIQFSHSVCDMNHLFEEVHQLALEKRRIAQKESIRLILRVPSSDVKILTDPGRVQQICLNLIDNSLKFTERGSIEFGYEIKDSRYLQCYVKDSGIGLRKEEIKILFNRFKRIEDTSTRKNSGSGLGLTLSKYIVSLLGGKIWVDSVYGEGATFFFTIPLTSADELNSMPEQLREQEAMTHYNWKNKVILLVEDDEINVQFIEAILSPYQVQIIHAPNGLQGIELCKSIPHIDLVLMDMKMPEMNGHDACREIKKLRSGLPIIAQTAYGLREDRQKCIEAGCDDYISKPISINDLLAKIQRLIN